MSHDDEDDAELSRRELLERAGAALGLLALAPACADDDGSGDGAAGDAPAAGADPQGNPGGDGAAGAGAAADNSSTDEPAGSAGNAGAGDDPASAGADGDGASAGAGGSAGGAGDSGEAGAAGDPPGSGRTVVSFVRNDDVDMAVARAVELAGGLGAIQAGQTVFIKPNAVSDRAVGTPGIRTSNEVLAAVVRLVKTRDPGRIIVGDRSARSFDTEQVFEATGMAEAALAAGADEVYRAPSAAQAPDDWMLVQPQAWEETWSAPGGILAMRKILEADHLINVPTCKNHQYAVYSLARKNFVGGIDDSSRDPLHYLQSIQADFEVLSRDVAVLSQIFNPLMNVVDATTVLVNGGPGGDGANAVRVDSGLILAGTDKTAIDAAGVALLQLEQSRTTVSTPDRVQDLIQRSSPWQLPQITNAVELGDGISGPDEAELIFDSVDAADEDALRMRFGTT